MAQPQPSENLPAAIAASPSLLDDRVIMGRLADTLDNAISHAAEASKVQAQEQANASIKIAEAQKEMAVISKQANTDKIQFLDRIITRIFQFGIALLICATAFLSVLVFTGRVDAALNLAEKLFVVAALMLSGGYINDKIKSR